MRSQPWVISFSMVEVNFGLLMDDLWLPHVRAAATSFCMASSEMGLRGYVEPWDRRTFVCDQRGW